MEGRLGLADAIASLRSELQEATSEGVGKAVQFNVGAVDLEFQVEVGREGGGSAKVRFWVVEAGAEGKVTSSSTQIVRIHLEPVDAVTRKQLLTADVDPPSGSGSRPASAPSAATG